MLFTFHGTIAQVEDPVHWVRAAAADCGVDLDQMKATALADRLVTAGRPGGPKPDRVPPHLAELFADRNLDPHAHRAAYVGLAETVTCDIDGFAEALYDRQTVASGWRIYADASITLRALRAAAIPVGVVSDTGFDLRPLANEFGIGAFIDGWALSCELGRCKPDPAMFWHACRDLGVDPEATLMVGNSLADAAAVAAGCRTLLLPPATPGGVNGLTEALSLALG